MRKKCSSGGIGFEIGKQLLQEGYKVVGCRYDATLQRAEHYIATTVEELIPSIGSKYIQSYTKEAFKKIDRKQKYLVTLRELLVKLILLGDLFVNLDVRIISS